MNDTTGRSLTFGRVLAASLALARRLETPLSGQQAVGVVLPASVGGALANLALTLLGKTTVNVNFTGPADAVRFAVEQAGVRTVVTSRAFLAAARGFHPPCDSLYLEDLAAGLTTGERLAAAMRALFAPARSLVTPRPEAADPVHTLIFSSGATGQPKGVMLTHYNLVSNMEAFAAVLRFTARDAMCAALPFFHSFGYTCTLWFPLLVGFRVCYHPNPLEGEKVARAVRENGCTILLATPTFLQGYLRRARPEDFASLRVVVTGAEKLRRKTADAFEARFGVRPLEGYGVTELSPVVSVNLPDVAAGGRTQAGSRPGTIGHPIPGLAVKVVGDDGTTPLPPGREGLLCVKGPNVMRGYLNRPDKTAEAVRDGWYDTGDIARLDEDGFVTITDRASRFSKIGGEMVPHIAVEEAYLKALNPDERVLVVTAVADERRGERLVVLYTDRAGTAESLHAILAAGDLPNLWKPRPEDYVRVDAIPLLGSGKLDLRAVKDLASRSAPAPGAPRAEP